MQRSQEQLSVLEETMPRSMEELLTERDGILSELEGLRKVNGDGETGFGERRRGAAADAAGSRSRRRYGSGAGGGIGAAEGTTRGSSDRVDPTGGETGNGSAEGGGKKRHKR